MSPPDGPSPAEAVRDVLDELGAVARPQRRVIARLMAGPASIADLVRHTHLSRRSVEQIVNLMAPDCQVEDGTYTLDADRAGEYERLAQLPPAPSREERVQLAARIGQLLTDIPRPNTNLDHVQATAQTVARRACWLDETYDLRGRTVAFIGDHDLTSIALALLRPEAVIRVVDVDECLLGFVEHHLRDIDGTGVSAGIGVSHATRFADLRDGLPDDMAGTADIFVTDPPYTPAGIQLFTGRGLESLRSALHGRGHIAYGFGDQLPGLGWRVQKALTELRLVFDAILPQFNDYTGAQAIGSASSWYVVRPTAKSMAAWGPRRDELPREIYTHGAASTESTVAPDVDRARLYLMAPDGGSQPASDEPQPPRFFDLTREPDAALFRHLIAVTEPADFLVAAHHPEVRRAGARSALQDDLAGLLEISFERGGPVGPHVAVRVRPVLPAPGEPPAAEAIVGAQFLARGHSTVRVAAIEALRKAHRLEGRSGAASRAELKAAVEANDAIRPHLDTRGSWLPRGILIEIVTELRQMA